MSEVPDQTYYPSCFVRLALRFEDFAAPDTPEPPRKPPQLRRGRAVDNKDALDIETRDGTLVLVPRDAVGTRGSPQEQSTSADRRTHYIDAIIPSRATVMRNGIRQADTSSIELKYRDLPLDPRVVRSCAAEVYIGTVTADEFAAGIAGQTRSDADDEYAAGLPLNLIPRFYTDKNGRRRSNLRFQGWVDEWETEFGDADEPFVRLECTDNTRLLIEQDAPMKLAVPPDTPIDRAVAEYLANFPQFVGLGVRYLPTVEPSQVPKVGESLSKTAFRPQLGPTPSGGGGNKMSVWDHLTDVAGAIGHTVRFETFFDSTGNGIPSVVIQRARTLYDRRFVGRDDDPFRGRIFPDSIGYQRNRVFIYGRNLSDTTFSRKYARYAPFNVEVRSYLPERKRTLVARYPDSKDKRQKRVSPGNASDQKWQIIRVQGVKDEQTLKIIAQGVYETVGRRELECRFSTKDLASYGGSASDPDALDVRVGDAIDVHVNRAFSDDDYNSVNTVEEQAANQAERLLLALGYSAEFARAYAAATQNVGFPVTYRVREFGIDWDGESEAVTLDFVLSNYLEVRADVRLQEGEIEPEETSGGEDADVVVVDDA